MKHIKWVPNLALGIEPLDLQHKKLLSILNDLIAIINASTHRYHLEAIVHRMVDYAKLHFSSEEALLKEAGYPDLVEHAKLHKLFILKILDIDQNFNPYSTKMRSDLLDFLSKWYVNHIGNVDQCYSVYIKKLSPQTIKKIIDIHDPPMDSEEELPWD